MVLVVAQHACTPTDDLDSYWTSKDAPEATKAKKVSADKGSLDDDLDSYMGKRGGATEE